MTDSAKRRRYIRALCQPFYHLHVQRSDGAGFQYDNYYHDPAALLSELPKIAAGAGETPVTLTFTFHRYGAPL